MSLYRRKLVLEKETGERKKRTLSALSTAPPRRRRPGARRRRARARPRVAPTAAPCRRRLHIHSIRTVSRVFQHESGSRLQSPIWTLSRVFSSRATEYARETFELSRVCSSEKALVPTLKSQRSISTEYFNGVLFQRSIPKRTRGRRPRARRARPRALRLRMRKRHGKGFQQ